MEKQTIEYGTPATLNTNSFIYSGYTFSGWNTEKDGSGTSYANGASVSNLTEVDGETITLYAQWTRNYIPPSGGGGGTPTEPDEPETDIEEHPDGSTTETTTETTTNKDGSNTETTTVVEKDPEGNVTLSTVTETTTSEKEEDGVKETTTSTTVTTSDGEGNKTGSTTSSTTTTVTEVSTTIVEREEVKDAEDNVTSSTEKVTETVRIEGGTLTSETTEVKDASGNVTSSTEKVTAESEDGAVRTASEAGSTGTTVSTVIIVTGDGAVDDSLIETAVAQSAAVSDKVSADDPAKVIQIESSSSDVTLSPSSMSAIADTGAEFKVVCETGSMSLDSDVVETLKEPQKDVTVSMSESKDDDLTDAQIASKGDRLGVSLTATVGDETYHLLGGTVTVTIPYSTSMGADPSALGVFYIDEDGARTFMQSVYDEILKSFVFKTDHFSLFVVDDLPAPADENNTLLYAGIAIATVTVVFVAAIIIRRGS